MSKTKHTPGPWPVDNGWELRPDGGDFIVYFDPKSATGRANANLIKAAPDLLEALEGIMRAPMSTKAMLAAHSAIAKAKGE